MNKLNVKSLTKLFNTLTFSEKVEFVKNINNIYIIKITYFHINHIYYVKDYQDFIEQYIQDENLYNYIKKDGRTYSPYFYQIQFTSWRNNKEIVNLYPEIVKKIPLKWSETTKSYEKPDNMLTPTIISNIYKNVKINQGLYFDLFPTHVNSNKMSYSVNYNVFKLDGTTIKFRDFMKIKY